MKPVKELIREHLIKDFYSARIAIYHEDINSKEIIRLKGELRKLTHKYDDFYKRDNGYYNDNLEIFILPKTSSAYIYGALVLYVDNEEYSKEVADAIIEAVNGWYEEKEYYTITMNEETCDYSINKKSWNEYELYHTLHSLGKVQANGIHDVFDTEIEAQRVVYNFIQGKIAKKQKELNELLYKQQTIAKAITVK